MVHMCLSPAHFSAPTYVTSTETSLTVEWQAPRNSNGCPITKYQLFRDTGNDDSPTVQVGADLEPDITRFQIDLGAAASSQTFRVGLIAFNDAGSVQSGVGTFLLADVPAAPAPPTNDATATNDRQI